MRRDLEKVVEEPHEDEFVARAERVLRHARKISAKCQAVLQALYEREKKAGKKRSEKLVGGTSRDGDPGLTNNKGEAMESNDHH